MLDLKFNYKGFKRMALGVIKKPLIMAVLLGGLSCWLLYLNRPIPLLAPPPYTTGAVFSLVVVMFVLTVWVASYYRRFISCYQLCTARKRLSMTLHKEGMTGVTVAGMPAAVDKREITKVELSSEHKLSVYVDRKRNKFLGKVVAVVYELYLTPEASKDVSTKLSGLWGSDLLYKTDRVGADADAGPLVWVRR